MTSEEAKQAFTRQVKVVHNCRCSGTLIVYKRIKEYKYIINNGKLFISVGMIDDSERCLVWDAPRNVELFDENKPLDKEHYFVDNTRQHG